MSRREQVFGSGPASFDKYLGQFSEPKERVQDFLAAAAAAMQEHGIPVSELEQLKAEHREMGARYREALKPFDRESALAGQTVDKLVSGMDRVAGAGMEKAAMHMGLLTQERIAAEIAEASYQRARNVFAALAALGLTVAAILSLAIRRMRRRSPDESLPATSARRSIPG